MQENTRSYCYFKTMACPFIMSHAKRVVEVVSGFACELEPEKSIFNPFVRFKNAFGVVFSQMLLL